jgi:hypothetical protein
MTTPPPPETTFRTAKLGVLVYQQRYKDRHGAEVYARPWYMRKTVCGTTAVFPLGLKKRTAEKIAEEIAAFLSIPSNTLDQALAKYNPRAKARAEKVTTIGECIECYGKALRVVGRRGASVSQNTFEGYKSCMRTFLRRVDCYRNGVEFESFNGRHNVDYSKWLNLPTSFLTAKAVMDFKMATVPVDTEDADEEEILAGKITADTTIRGARSLFSKQALRYYGQVGLRVGDLTEFHAEPLREHVDYT